jgi:ribosomal protein L30/L7E
MKELDVELILTRSPQAKGRVERRHGVFQDRFVKALRLKKIATLVFQLHSPSQRPMQVCRGPRRHAESLIQLLQKFALQVFVRLGLVEVT